MAFHEIDYKEMKINPFTMFLSEWGLVGAGTPERRNAMTIGWGTLGILWGKPVAIVFIRPQRFTKEFVEQNEKFSVSFYPAEYRKALEILGTKSGRDGDKIAESGLTPFFSDGTIGFEEAHTLLICRKLFGGQQFEASKFIDLNLAGKMYPDRDYHYLFVGEIEKVYVS